MQDFMSFEHKDPTIESFEFLHIFEKAKNVPSPTTSKYETQNQALNLSLPSLCTSCTP
jgi:hypothetical protein